MKRNEDFRNALGEPDEYFQQSVMDTLNQLNRQAERESRPKWSFSMRLVSSFAALVLVIGGIVIAARNDHHDYLTPTATSPVDITATSQATVTPLASPPSIETEHAVLTFTEAVKDGSEVRITVDIQPKHEHTLALNADHLLSTSVQYVSDLYGIQPDSPEQSLYEWAVEHGFPEALAVDLNTAWDGITSPFRGSWQIEKHTLREDGSSVMTIVGPAVESDIYDLDYHIIPWNMEEKGESFLYLQHIGGLIRLTLTDTASHIPEIEVLPKTNTPEILPEDEYSRQAWDLSMAESYTDLVNNIDARIGQVYCIKGVVQDVFSAGPMRVLINTSEDGTSRPVIIENPSYRPFLPWKAGEFYRIYADVSYMDDNIPVLTARYIHTGPLESTEETIETDQAVMTVRKAVTDGCGVFITVEVTPKGKNTLALYDGVDAFSGPDEIGAEPDYNGESLYQWAVNHGYTKILNVSFTSPYQEETASFGASLQSRGNKNRNSGLTAHDSDTVTDGKTMILAAGCALPDTDVYDLAWELVPCDISGLSGSRIEMSETFDYEKLEHGVMRVPVTSTEEVPEIIAEYTTADPTSDDPEEDINVTVRFSSLAYYLDVSTRGDRLNDVIQCGLLDVSKTFGYAGDVNMCSFAKQADNSTLIRQTWRFDEPFPDTLTLSLFTGSGETIKETLHRVYNVNK